MLSGTFTALVTPFNEDRLDEEGLIRNIHDQLEAEIEGLVLLGSTGEGATLTQKERDRVMELAMQEARGKTLLIAGTGSNSTQEAIEKTQRAQELGADMALVVAPYYNKPTQEGLYRHFEAIASAVDLPLIVYNHPGRTGVNIEVDTLLRLAKLPEIVGVKEASDEFSHVAEVLSRVDSSFSVLSGNDLTALALIAMGAKGVISCASNLIPKDVKALIDAALQADFVQARAMHNVLFNLFQATGLETNPLPIKEMMNVCGLPAGPCRLPLCEMQAKNREKIEMLMIEMGLTLTV